jgi:hypothetical protein
VLKEGLDNQLARLLGVRDARKQPLLFFAKVWHRGVGEEGQERRRCSSGVLRVCAATQAPRGDQGVMMLVGERDQRSMPSHSVQRTGPGFVKERLRYEPRAARALGAVLLPAGT